MGRADDLPQPGDQGGVIKGGGGAGRLNVHAGAVAGFTPPINNELYTEF